MEMVILSTSVKRFSVSRMQDFFVGGLVVVVVVVVMVVVGWGGDKGGWGLEVVVKKLI